MHAAASERVTEPLRYKGAETPFFLSAVKPPVRFPARSSELGELGKTLFLPLTQLTTQLTYQWAQTLVLYTFFIIIKREREG